MSAKRPAWERLAKGLGPQGTATVIVALVGALGIGGAHREASTAREALESDGQQWREVVGQHEVKLDELRLELRAVKARCEKAVRAARGRRGAGAALALAGPPAPPPSPNLLRRFFSLFSRPPTEAERAPNRWSPPTRVR